MITYVEGDLFSSTAQVLVNTVNTVGVMGKGIAKEFKAIYPEMFKVYQGYCERGELEPGKLLLYRTNNKWILNFPTKRHWRQKSRLVDIEAGLRTFASEYETLGIHSVAFPQLGCGNGELDWVNDVKPAMERALRPLPIDITVYLYSKEHFTAEHRNSRQMHDWLRSEPMFLPFSEFWADLVRLSAEQPTLQSAMCRVSIRREGEFELVEFEENGRPIVLSSDETRELWQQIRINGVLTSDDVAFANRGSGDAVFHCLARLPYLETLEVTRLARKSGELRGKMSEFEERRLSGLRMIPEKATSRNSSLEQVAITL